MFLAVSKVPDPETGESYAERLANHERLVEHALRRHEHFDYYHVPQALKVNVKSVVHVEGLGAINER